jgi:DnaJ-class molecular chaperone
MSEDNKPNWKICMENQKKVDEYDFPKIDPSKIKPIQSEPCRSCNGTGYKPQPPGYYGLSQCIYCGGSGKQTAIKTKKE